MPQKPQLTTEEKYRLYESSVQCSENDIEFINREYKKIFKKLPKLLREDFGGTGMLACDWVKQGKDYFAWAVDLDLEPINYGKAKHYSRLVIDEKSRMKYVVGNVLRPRNFKVDVVVAFNFSYFIFKRRDLMLNYFKAVRKGLKKEGAFFIDMFGGLDCGSPLEEETKHKNHYYYWDCEGYNPLTHESVYHIHFKVNQVKYEKVFTYDWRMWGVMELKEILLDAGFSEVFSYWEGDGKDGTGDGNFYATEKAENCDSWVTYLVARK